jgi:hypothetical protein
VQGNRRMEKPENEKLIEWRSRELKRRIEKTKKMKNPI